MQQFTLTLVASERTANLPGEKLISNGFELKSQHGVVKEEGRVKSIGELLYIPTDKQPFPGLEATGLRVIIKQGDEPSQYRATVSGYDPGQERAIYEGIQHMITGKGSGHYLKF